MPQNLTPGGKDKTLVKGAHGDLYIVDKTGAVTKLTAEQAAKVYEWIAETEEKLSHIQGVPPLVGGGVNLCVPDIFPEPQ
jgi:hypothetical protein